MKKIKFYSLGVTQGLEIKKYLREYKSFLTKGQFILGNEVLEFEKAISKKIKKKYTVGVSSGTNAIYLALLAAGIKTISGKFDKGENVLIIDEQNNKLARGLASFSSVEIVKIKGRQSSEIEKILGYISKTEVVHKDDMVKL